MKQNPSNAEEGVKRTCYNCEVEGCNGKYWNLDG
jgi:hypothetical protein